MVADGGAAFPSGGGGGKKVATREELYEMAGKVKRLFEETVRTALKEASVDDQKVFKLPSLKKRARAGEKAKNEYKGDVSRLVDIVRGSCIFDSVKDLVAFHDALMHNKNIRIARLKSRFAPPLFNGYRDFLVNFSVVMPSGETFICELQLHHACKD